MPEPRAISGVLRIGIQVAPDGVPCVAIEQPGGTFLLPKEQGLCYAFTIFATVRNLFRNVEELEQAVLAAQGEAERIVSVPLKVDKDGRPVVQ